MGRRRLARAARVGALRVGRQRTPRQPETLAQRDLSRAPLAQPLAGCWRRGPAGDIVAADFS